MKRKILPAVFALAVLAGVVYALLGREAKNRDSLVFYGSVDLRQVRVAFNSSGRIQQMQVREGDKVQANQLIAELDATRYEAAVARAEAQVAVQKEIVARLLAGSRPEEIAEVQARVRAAATLAKDAGQKLTRAQELAKNEYVSQQQLEAAQTAAEVARANLEALQQTAELVALGPRKEDLAAAQAQLRVYEATLALAKQELADTRLYAPADGIIQNRVLEPGDMAFPQNPAYTLALNDPIWVRAYVPEPDLGKISEGMPAQVMTDSFPGKTYEGTVGFISPTAEFTPKQVETSDLRTRLVYQVRVNVKNPRNELRLGMPVTVRIALDPARPAGATDADRARKE